MSGVTGIQSAVNSSGVNFCGNKKEARKARKAESDAVKFSKPLKTHKGTIWGGLMAALLAVGAILTRKSPNASLVIDIAVAAAYLIGGIFIDRKTNKNRAEFETKRQEIDDKTLATEDKHIRFTKNGNAYYKSSVGKKVGTLIGSGVAIVSLLTKSVGRSGAAIKLLGGFLLGALIDHGSNRVSRKFADKKAKSEANMREQAQMSAFVDMKVDEQPVQT